MIIKEIKLPTADKSYWNYRLKHPEEEIIYMLVPRPLLSSRIMNMHKLFPEQHEENSQSPSCGRVSEDVFLLTEVRILTEVHTTTVRKFLPNVFGFQERFN